MNQWVGPVFVELVPDTDKGEAATATNSKQRRGKEGTGTLRDRARNEREKRTKERSERSGI